MGSWVRATVQIIYNFPDFGKLTSLISYLKIIVINNTTHLPGLWTLNEIISVECSPLAMAQSKCSVNIIYYWDESSNASCSASLPTGPLRSSPIAWKFSFFLLHTLCCILLLFSDASQSLPHVGGFPSPSDLCRMSQDAPLVLFWNCFPLPSSHMRRKIVAHGKWSVLVKRMNEWMKIASW